MLNETRRVGLIHATSKNLGMEVPCVDPAPEEIEFVQWAHKSELDRVAVFEGKKGKGAATGRVPHQEGSTLMRRIQNMIVAYGTTVELTAATDTTSGEVILTEAQVSYSSSEVKEAKVWLKKNAPNAAIFLVKNSNATLDSARWLQTEAGKEALAAGSGSPSKLKKILELSKKKQLWVLESPEDGEKRKQILETFDFSLSKPAQAQYADGHYKEGSLLSRVNNIEIEEAESMTSEKISEELERRMDHCIIEYNVDCIFLEFMTWAARYQLLLGEADTLTDRNRLTKDRVWKKVRAEVIEAAGQTQHERRFSELVNNQIEKGNYGRSFDSSGFLTDLYSTITSHLVHTQERRENRKKVERTRKASGEKKEQKAKALLAKEEKARAKEVEKAKESERSKALVEGEKWEREKVLERAGTHGSEREKVLEKAGTHGSETYVVGVGRAQGTCFKWEQRGECAFGDKCRYSHDKAGSNPLKGRKSVSFSGECFKFRDQGECVFGDACRFEHVGKGGRKKGDETEKAREKEVKVCAVWKANGVCRDEECLESHEGRCNVCNVSSRNHQGRGMHILCMKANTKEEAKTNESGPDCYERLNQAETQRSRRESRRRQNVDESSHAIVRVVWQSTEVEEDTEITDREIESFSCERLSNRGNESDIDPCLS